MYFSSFCYTFAFALALSEALAAVKAAAGETASLEATGLLLGSGHIKNMKNQYFFMIFHHFGGVLPGELDAGTVLVGDVAGHFSAVVVRGEVVAKTHQHENNLFLLHFLQKCAVENQNESLLHAPGSKSHHN